MHTPPALRTAALEGVPAQAQKGPPSPLALLLNTEQQILGHKLTLYSKSLRSPILALKGGSKFCEAIDVSFEETKKNGNKTSYRMS